MSLADLILVGLAPHSSPLREVDQLFHGEILSRLWRQDYEELWQQVQGMQANVQCMEAELKAHAIHPPRQSDLVKEAGEKDPRVVLWDPFSDYVNCIVYDIFVFLNFFG